MNFRTEEPFFLKQLKLLSSVKTRVYFGYPNGNPYSEIAKDLSVGVRGPVTYESKHFKDKQITISNIPARNFLVDGFMFIETSVDQKVGEVWKDLFSRGIVALEPLGEHIVKGIKNWVATNPYENDAPNSERVIADKGKNFPLVDSTEMIDKMEYVITNRIKA